MFIRRPKRLENVLAKNMKKDEALREKRLEAESDQLRGTVGN